MPDVINGCFLFTAAIVMALNVVKIYHDKEVRGISMFQITHFLLWSYWGCFFYAYIGAWWSLYSNTAISIIDTIWLVQILYYKINWRPT
jgi:hypothetical protein